ncbi:MAG: ADP-forming succinate--CoA ligase subunit beta [Chlamydiales bacterium]|nr:ADP-forming succinate--CoA ligase subunit beta [Chlamydiales bacterium]
MNTHEYQAKEMLKRWGVPIPAFGVASSIGEAKQIIQLLGLNQAVVKIQVHAGGRGKGGGIKFGKSKEEIIAACHQLIGMKLVNQQTGPQGIIAYKVLISKPVEIKKEYYLGAIVSREKGRPILIASPEGGMEIEEIAVKMPEKLLTLPIELSGTLRSYHLVRLANFMGWKGEIAKKGIATSAALARAFIETDASLLEINPFVETPTGELFAIDAKLSVDDNALYRQKEITGFYDPTQISSYEVAAKEKDLSYISLEGNIGCMVNGAGLAMATMDIIHFYGGKPANFLDVGGGADKEKVAAGFKIILSDSKVKAILVNIFGGIMNCATIAEGVIAAAKETSLSVPLVVRLEGTNVEGGRNILKQSGLSIISAEGMADAAQKVTQAAGAN